MVQHAAQGISGMEKKVEQDATPKDAITYKEARTCKTKTVGQQNAGIIRIYRCCIPPSGTSYLPVDRDLTATGFDGRLSSEGE